MNLLIALPVRRGLSGGSRKYLAELVPRLRQNPVIKRLAILVPQSLGDEVPQMEPDAVVAFFGKQGTINWIENRLSNSLFRSFHPDVVLTLTCRLVAVKGVAHVIMFRNMEPPLVSFWKNPFLESVRNIARLYAARRACRQADGVIAVSRFVKDFLIHRWRVPSFKVAAIYHGVECIGDDFITCASGWNERSPFLLTAGSIRPARGLEDLLQAIAKLASLGWRLSLRVAGAVDPGMDRYYYRLRRLAASLGVAAQVEWLGGVPRDELRQLMLGCNTFVVTSRAEACPNVVLEAMACGCSIISTLQPPMPELLGEAALYYPPGNSEILADQILRAHQETGMATQQRRRAALFRARSFSWDRTATETVQFLQQIVTSVAAQRGSLPLRSCA